MEKVNAETLYAMLAKKDALVIGELPNIMQGASSRDIAGIAVTLSKLIEQRGGYEHADLMLGMLEETYNQACRKERQDQAEINLVNALPFMILRPPPLLDYRPQTTDRHLGAYKGQNRVNKPVIMELQKGQRSFEVNGHPIPAGSIKAATKKYNKLVKQGILPASPELEPYVTTQAE